MDHSLAIKSVFTGLSVAAPIGLMSMLTTRRSIDRGLAARLVSALGIASADASYGAIAVGASILVMASISIATGRR